MKIQRTQYQLVCRQFIKTLLAMKKFEQRENELYNKPFSEFEETLDAKLEFLKDEFTPEELHNLRNSSLLLETQFPGCCFVPGKVFIQFPDGSFIKEIDESDGYDANLVGWFMSTDVHGKHYRGFDLHESVDQYVERHLYDFRLDDV